MFGFSSHATGSLGRSFPLHFHSGPPTLSLSNQLVPLTEQLAELHFLCHSRPAFCCGPTQCSSATTFAALLPQRHAPVCCFSSPCGGAACPPCPVLVGHDVCGAAPMTPLPCILFVFPLRGGSTPAMPSSRRPRHLQRCSHNAIR